MPPPTRIHAENNADLEEEHRTFTLYKIKVEETWEQRFDALAALARTAGVDAADIEAARKRPWQGSSASLEHVAAAAQEEKQAALQQVAVRAEAEKQAALQQAAKQAEAEKQAALQQAAEQAEAEKLVALQQAAVRAEAEKQVALQQAAERAWHAVAPARGSPLNEDGKALYLRRLKAFAVSLKRDKVRAATSIMPPQSSD